MNLAPLWPPPWLGQTFCRGSANRSISESNLLFLSGHDNLTYSYDWTVPTVYENSQWKTQNKINVVCENTLYYLKAQRVSGCFCYCPFQLIASMLIPTIFLFLFPSVQIYVLVGRRLEIKISFLVAFTTTWDFKGLCFLQSIILYHGFLDASLFNSYYIKAICDLIEALKWGKQGELTYAIQKFVCC